MISRWEEKVWGFTRTMERDLSYSRHELIVKAGGFSSIHYHKQRANRFIIESGIVKVVEFNRNEIIKQTMLKCGQRYEIPSLVIHMFLVYADGIVNEEYYPDRGGAVDINDIIRFTIGDKVAVCELDSIPDDLIKRFPLA